MTHRNLSISIIVLLLLSIVSFPGSWTSPVQGSMSGDEPPTHGNWVVEHDSSIRDEVILLNGNLTVTNSSVLDLTNVVLRINCTQAGEFGIYVEAGSSLIAENATFTRGGLHDFSFTFLEGSTGALNDSLIEYAGASSLMGLAIQSEAVDLTNSTIRESYNGVVVQSPAIVSGNTIYNTSVGLALADSDAGNDVEADNTFQWENHGNTIANIRYHHQVSVLIQDQDGQAVEGAQVYLNDTLDQNWLDTVTPASGQIGPFWLVAWEVTIDDLNQSLEPYNLTAMRSGKQNSTLVFPLNVTTLVLELPLLPDLVVEDSQILWGATPVTLAVVPSGRDNGTQYRYQILDETSQFPTDWYEPWYNDSAWNISAAPFGDKDQAGTSPNTIWDSEGADPYTKDLVLVRHSFTLPQDARVLNSALQVAYNNYCTPYLNGHQIYEERGGNTHSASYWNGDGDADVDPDWFTEGENIIAVYGRDFVYNGDHGFNSQWLDMELTAEYYIPGRGDLVVDYSTLIVATVENRGVAAAQGVEVNLYNDTTLMDTKTLDLAIGEQKNVFFDWTPGHNGTQNLTVKVDEGQAIDEENDTNNNATAAVFVGGYGINLTTNANRTATTYNLTSRFELTVYNYGDINDNVTLTVTPMSDATGWQTQLAPQLMAMEPKERLNTTLTIQPARGAPIGNYSFIVAANSQFQTSGYTTLVPSHSNWRWLETDNPPSGWEEPDYNDSGWSEAPAPFGAGSNFESVATGWGSNGWTSNDEAVFRLRFDLTRPIKEAVLKLAVADGAQAYLNGVQVVDDLQGDENDNSRGASHWDYITGEKPSGLAALDPGLLVMGENVLAIRVFDTGQANFFDAEFEVAYHGSNTQEVVIEILPTHDFDLDSYTDEFEHPTNTTQVYAIDLHNYGHFNETIEVEMEVVTEQGDWTYNLSAGNISFDPGTGGRLSLEVFGNESLTLEDHLDLSFIFRSQEASWVNHTYDLMLWGDPPHYEFQLTSDHGDEEHVGGSTIVYPIEITNTGNLNTTIKTEWSILGQCGNWTVALAPAQVTLQEDEVGQFDLEIHGAKDLRDWDNLNVSITFYLDNHFELNQTYMLNLTAVPADRGFSLPGDFANASQLNGTVEVYTLAVTNQGSLDEVVKATLSVLELKGSWSARLLDDELDLAVGNTVDIEIEVTADPDLRFWDYVNLTVNVTLEDGARLYHQYALNITPIFDDDYPPDTKMVSMDRWVRNSTVALEWEIIQDRDDTAYFYIYFKTLDPGGNMSDYELLDKFTVDITSIPFEVEHGWVYYFYSLGQDGSNNLELDRGTYDTYFIVDLEPPESRVSVAELGPGVTSGVTKASELSLNWEPVNFSESSPDYEFTIQVRERPQTGAFGAWTTLDGLDNVSIQQGEFSPIDGRVYQFRAIATDQAGWVEDKTGWDVQVTVDATPPRSGLESLPAITTAKSHTLGVIYDNKDDVTHLQVHYAQFPDGDIPIWGKYTWLNGGSFYGSNIPDELTFDNLKNGQRYIYRLLATDDNDNQELRDGLVEYYVGNGSHNQFLQLSKLPLPAQTVPYSSVTVFIEGAEEEQLLEYFTRDSMPPHKSTAFHLDYATGIIHFGDNSTGYIPPDGTRLRITYSGYDAWTVVDTLAPTPPGAIHHHTFDTQAGTATLSWHPSTSNDVTAYRLEMATEKAGPWSDVLTLSAPPENRDINDVLVEALAADTTYHFQVIAIDRAGWESNPNNLISVNERPVTSGEDDDDEGGGSSTGFVLVLLMVLLAIAGAAGYTMLKRQPGSAELDKRRAMDSVRRLEPLARVPITGTAMAGVTVIGKGGERDRTDGTDKTGFEPVKGSEDEFSCLMCGMIFKPASDGDDLECPGCGHQTPQSDDVDPKDRQVDDKSDDALSGPLEQEPSKDPGEPDGKDIPDRDVDEGVDEGKGVDDDVGREGENRDVNNKGEDDGKDGTDGKDGQEDS